MRTPFIRLATAIALAAVIAACGDDDSLPRVDRSLFAYDRGQPLAASVEQVARRRGAVVERVGYRSFDGARVPALFVRPEGARGRPCVLFQHGFASDKRSGAVVWSSLAGQGIATMAIDARFHGERARGSASAAAVAGSPRLLYRFFRETAIDLRRALDYLGRRGECDPARLGYIGASFGAMAGALVAGVDERVQAPVLLVGGGDWSTFLEGSDVFLPGIEARPAAYERALDLLEPLDPARWAPRISPRPVLVAYGTEDTVVVPEAAEALADAARDPKEIVTYPGEHGEVLTSGEVREAFDRWVRDRILGAKPPG